jgi:DNA-binding response OmpR family regulator
MRKILVIEDDPDIETALRMPLEANSYEVTTASTCEDGLRMVKETVPNLIILDVMTRTLAAGFRALLQLRSSHPRSEYAAYRHIPILMLTRLHDATFMRFYPHEGSLSVDGVAGNPVEPDELLDKVQSLIKW